MNWMIAETEQQQQQQLASPNSSVFSGLIW